MVSAHSYALGRSSLAWPHVDLRWLRQECAGVTKLLFRLQLVAFRCIPDRPNPHPNPLPEGEGIMPPSRERRGAPRGEIPNLWLIWLNLVWFTPTVEAENETTLASFGTPLAHRSLVWGVPAWPSMWPRWVRLASSGVARSGETLKPSHFLSFRLIPLVDVGLTIL